MSQKVSFLSQGLRLYGDLLLPPGRPPGVLLSHGLESSKDGTKGHLFAERLGQRGIASLRFNYRGCGEGEERSQGEFAQSTLTGRLADFKAALEFLKASGVDPQRLGVIGSSFGGAVAIASGERAFRAIVLLATPARFTEKPLPEAPFPPAFWEDARKYNLFKAISRTSAAIIIHGERDEIVPLEHAYELYQKAPEPKALEIIKGADHRLSDLLHLEKALSLALDWLQRYL